jgi:carbonic anhydrase
VHRNVANIVVHSDLNALSRDAVRGGPAAGAHIIVVGHYGCAGVRAAMRGLRIGLADNWLRHVHDVRDCATASAWHASDDRRRRRTCCARLNVIEQVGNVALSTVVQDAWARGQEVGRRTAGCTACRTACSRTWTSRWTTARPAWCPCSPPR